MEKDYEHKYHENEDKNWWFVSRRKVIVQLLHDTDKQSKILDIGCSRGMLVSDLKQAGFANVSGIDFSREAVDLCKAGGLDVYLMDAQQPAFDDNTFDVLVASDCLEHLPDDNKAMTEWMRILKPGGTLIVFVPAFMQLWSEHDVANQHFRRYTLSGLKKLVLEKGFTINRSSYWNFALFLPVAAFRLLQRVVPGKSKKEPKGQMTDSESPFNGIMMKIMDIENSLFTRTGFFIGISAYVNATKPKK